MRLGNPIPMTMQGAAITLAQSLGYNPTPTEIQQMVNANLNGGYQRGGNFNHHPQMAQSQQQQQYQLNLHQSNQMMAQQRIVQRQQQIRAQFPTTSMNRNQGIRPGVPQNSDISIHLGSFEVALANSYSTSLIKCHAVIRRIVTMMHS